MSGRLNRFDFRYRISRLLSPRLCLCCGVPSAQNLFLCGACAAAIERVPNACQLCGLPTAVAGEVCPACLKNPPRWQRMIAPLVYQGETRRLIRDFKFHEKLYAGHALVDHLHQSFLRRDVDILIPVPLHDNRLIERGFNQSLEIARHLSRMTDIPLDRHSLRRVRETEPQSGLSLAKRHRNIRGAFAWRAHGKYRRIAVVDDVITTGSTVSEITRVLLRGGVEEVQVWGLARALRGNG